MPGIQSTVSKKRKPERYTEAPKYLIRASLKDKLRSELECPRASRTEHAAGCAGWLSESGGVCGIVLVGNQAVEKSRIVRRVKAKDVGLVRQVEDFAQQLQRHALSDADVSRQAQVERVERVVEA